LKFSHKQLITVICLALALGTIAIYSPVLRHDFINYDDPDYILNNSHVQAGLTWPGIVWAFKSGDADNWHPLTWISHMMDCQLFGVNSAAHHLMNVLFHAANTVLLFILLNYMTGAKWRSAFVSALFAWHPLHVESVAWASERKDVLSAFFWMLTLLCYAHYAKGPRESSSLAAPKPGEGGSSPSKNETSVHGGRGANHPLSSPFYLLALLFFACALMSKPMVVTLPFVLLLLDFWPLQRFVASGAATTSTLQRLLIEKTPFFLLSAASCVITLAVQKGAMWSSASLPFPFRLANALMSYLRYLSKIFVPTDLALIYPYPHSLPISGVIAAGIVLLLLSIVFVVQARRFPYLAVGWFWFLGTLVPVIGLVQAGIQSMADRYTYLPSIGIFILVTWGIGDLLASAPRKVVTAAVVGGLALCLCIGLTVKQLGYWRNSLTIFEHTVLVTTDNYAAYDCLGKCLKNAGRPDRAQQCFDEAIRIEPDYPLAQYDAGMNLIALGDPAGASNHLATAIQLWPGNAIAQYDFGVFLLQHGQPKEAADHFAAALAIKPDFSEARAKLEKLDKLNFSNKR
jgi:protein O-mannosyl-transferase